MNSLQDILAKVRGQMPGFHVPESVAGGLAGLGGGYLYHKFKQRNDSPKRQRSALAGYQLRSRLIRGAILGALSGNLAGDRVRRLLSNIPTMAGYDPGLVMEGIKRDGMSGIFRGAVLDKPLDARPNDLFFDKAKPGGWPEALTVRRELLRRGLGVHSEQKDNFFQNAGSIVGSDGRNYPKIELNKRFYDNAAGILDPKAKGIWKSLWGDSLKFDFEDEAEGNLRTSDVFGGFPVEEYGRVKRMTDYWDFDLSPVQKALGMELAKQVVRDPRVWNRPIQGEELNNQLFRTGGSGTAGKALTSLALRKVFNDALATKSPVFDQFAVMPRATDKIRMPRMLSATVSQTQGGPDRDRLIDLLYTARVQEIPQKFKDIASKAQDMEVQDFQRLLPNALGGS